MRSFRLALFALFPLLLLACEDPSNVGLGLIGDSGGEPGTVVAPVESMEAEPIRDVTGGAVSLTTANPTPRILVGMVADPIAASVEATGHIDFSAVSGISDAFRNGAVSAAELRLSRDYVYGDTTSTLELEIRDIPGAWDARAPVDTTIATGGVVTMVTTVASSRELIIPMPEEWLEANDEVLRSTDFTTEWQGLAIVPVAGDAVLGFSTSSARLRVVSASDTVDYVSSRALTTTRVEPSASPAPFLQDGSGVALRLIAEDINADTADLLTVGVNGVSVRIPVDTVAASQAPPGFVRPPLAGLRLTGRAENEGGEPQDVFVADAVLAEGRYLWPIGTLPESYFQDLLSNELRNPTLTLSVPPTLFTITPAIIAQPGSGSAGPSILFVLTSATI